MGEIKVRKCRNCDFYSDKTGSSGKCFGYSDEQGGYRWVESEYCCPRFRLSLRMWPDEEDPDEECRCSGCEQIRARLRLARFWDGRLLHIMKVCGRAP